MEREQIQQALAGPVASLRTPFHQDGSLDYSSLRQIVDFSIQAGSRALVLTWGDSLFSLLSDQEIGEVTKVVVEQAAGRAAVVACTGMWASPQAVEFAGFCRELGADLLLVFLPTWYPGCSTPEAILAHHAALAAQIPVAVNSAELHRACGAGGEDLARTLLEHVGNVIAMKADVQGDFDRRVTSLVRDRWTVFAGGTKAFHLDLLPYGCQGYFSTFLMFRPEVARAYWRAICASDLASAVTLIEQIDRPFFDYISAVRGGFDAALHGIMELGGLAQRWRRAPFYSLDEGEMWRLAEFLETLPYEIAK